VDRFTEELPLKRETATILFADVVESVLHVQPDELAAVERIRALLAQIARDIVPAFDGRLIERYGDGILLAFGSSRQAVACAEKIHLVAAKANAHKSSQGISVLMRIGIHNATVLTDDAAIYGLGVNLASRIVSLAQPQETVMTATVRDGLIDGLDARLLDMGECYLKHLKQSVRIFKASYSNLPKVSGLTANDNINWRPGIAVLTLECRLGDHVSETVGQLIADNLSAQLSRTSEFRVVSRLSAHALRSRSLAADECGRALQAQYIISGSICMDSQNAVFQLELCKAQVSEITWARGFRVDTRELLATGSTALADVSQQIHSQLLKSEFNFCANYPLPTIASHSLLLGSITLMHRMSRSDFGLAKNYLEALVERHPRSPTPRAWLAKWYTLAVAQNWTDQPKSEATQAWNLVRSAVELNEHDALALSIMGIVHGYVQKDFAAATAAYRAAIDANPNEPLAWIGLATLNAWQGSAEDAVGAAERALALTPLEPTRYYFDSLAAAAMVAGGRYDRAIELSESALRLNRGLLASHIGLVIAHAMRGTDQAAREAAQGLLALYPEYCVQRFRGHSPSYRSPSGKVFAQALLDAGIPDAPTH
jgi:adenylate cyclase